MKTDKKILLSRYYDIKKRCTNKNAENYYLYGGRGISCIWESSEDFLGDMSEGFSPELQIDRIDNNGNYCKENCRWVTQKENSNNKRTNVFMELNGRTQTIKQWSEEYSMPYKRVYYRIKRFGYTLEQALTTPIKSKFTSYRYLKNDTLTTNGKDN